MLLARGEGEDEAAVTVAVDGLADEAAGHLADVLLFRCNDTAERAAVAQCHAEGLRFHADDVGLYGRTNDAERDRLGDADDEQCAFCMGNGGDGWDVFNDAEEVGALHQDSGGFSGDGCFERGWRRTRPTRIRRQWICPGR